MNQKAQSLPNKLEVKQFNHKRKTKNLLIFNISNKSFRHYFTHEVINFNQDNFKNLPKISYLFT